MSGILEIVFEKKGFALHNILKLFSTSSLCILAFLFKKIKVSFYQFNIVRLKHN